MLIISIFYNKNLSCHVSINWSQFGVFSLCCDCGTQIEPNPANMCVACLRTREDITEGIPKTGVLHFCRNCERYLQPPNHWVSAQLESKELLAVCLKKVNALSKEVW